MTFMRRHKLSALVGIAALCFLSSVFTVIGKREQLRHTEELKIQERKMQIVLEDELRNLQLEYATLTGYGNLHSEAQRLNMHTPRPGDNTFYYLPQAQGE